MMGRRVSRFPVGGGGDLYLAHVNTYVTGENTVVVTSIQKSWQNR